MALLKKGIAHFFTFLGILWTLAGATWTWFLFYFGRDAGFWGYRAWGRGLCRLMGIRVTVEGIEHWAPGATYVVASNHASIWDIVVLATLPRPHAWISKAEVGKVPVMGTTMKKMGCYFIRRDRSEKDLNVMRQVEDELRAGGVPVVIFPEGTRTRTGRLQPLKRGAFRLAQNSGVPLLPVGISGTFPIAPPGMLFSGRGHHAIVRVGAPFPVAPTRDVTEAIASFEKRLGDLLPGRA